MAGGELPFTDRKDAGALRTIGEVSSLLAIRPHVLRYWEDQFAQLQPLKRAGGRRLYRPQDVALIAEIDRLINREGYTLRGARTALGAIPASAEVAAQRPLERADLVSRLKAIRDELNAAIAE